MPTQFGPYLLLERISVGGMAEVYKAKEYGVEGFERTVAVKRILPHVAEDEEFIAMFKDEAKIAVQLNHGNIAQIYNLGNEQDSFYIALEYVNGRDLRAIFQRCQQLEKPMPVAQACYVIMKICEGLDYAHNKKDKYNRELNIVHRDVSPPNILVSFEGEVKLIDFGVAKAAGRASRTQAGILKGKFGYMSPEQVRGMPLDRRSDVFSVGVVLFEMLTSQRLFQAETDFATLEKVRAVDVPRPSSLNPEIPKQLEDIIYKALAREPEQRYQSSIELHDELQAFMFAQGLFYSRKDLAGWMRTHYAREIELEKEKASKQQEPPPHAVSRPRNRKTMMMSPTGRPPPPPPPPKKVATTTPPPPPRPGAGAPTRKPPTAAHRPVPGPPRPGQKRKTMVMTTSKPAALPKPPGAGGPSKSRPKPVATASYAAAAVPPASDFDWDDDELETRLFEGEADPPTAVDGSRPLAGFGAVPQTEGPSEAPTSIVPPHQQGQPFSPAPVAGLQRGGTMVPGGAQAAGRAPIPHPGPANTAPHPGMHGAPAAAMAGAGAPIPSPGGTQAVIPMPPQAPAQFEEPPQRRSAAPMIFGIVAAVLLTLGASAAVFYLLNERGYFGGGQQAGQAGTLTLNVTPTDAGVAVDGNAVTGESPFVITGLALGKHTLSVTKPEYLPFEREFDVADATGVAIPVKLHVRKVTLTLVTDPPRASVNLIEDGQARALGQGGGKALVTRKAGSKYEIEASLPGYITNKIPFEFNGEANQTVNMALLRDTAVAQVNPPTTPAAPPGTPPSAVDGTGPSAAAGDGGAKTPTPPTTPPSTPPSTSRPKSPKKPTGRKPPRKPKKPSTSPATTPKPPKKPADKTATLRIGTKAGVPPARVFVDGREVGKTPLAAVKVAPGRHRVLFRWPSGKERSRSVTVADGQVVVVKEAPA